jgi:hypothetical protein
MGNTKTLAIAAALGLGLIFSSPLVARAESQAGGLPALEDRVEFDEGLIAELETDVTELETLVATALHRLSAEFQNSGEISTTVGPAAGGTVVYDKTLKIPFKVAYITFSATGDTHGGSALLMTASVTNNDNVTTVCSPMRDAGLGGGNQFGAPWMTLVKLPTNPTIDAGGTLNNCRVGASTTPIAGGGNNGDGSGGSADCHDNAFLFSCCVLPTPAASGDPTQRVKIKMASSIGTGAADEVLRVFYEESTIYIDASSDATLCAGVGTAAH